MYIQKDSIILNLPCWTKYQNFLPLDSSQEGWYVSWTILSIK